MKRVATDIIKVAKAITVNTVTERVASPQEKFKSK